METVSIMMWVENKMICCRMGKQQIGRANNLNCKSVWEYYTYICASASYQGFHANLCLSLCMSRAGFSHVCAHLRPTESLEARLWFTSVIRLSRALKGQQWGEEGKRGLRETKQRVILSWRRFLGELGGGGC